MTATSRLDVFTYLHGHTSLRFIKGDTRTFYCVTVCLTLSTPDNRIILFPSSFTLVTPLKFVYATVQSLGLGRSALLVSRFTLLRVLRTKRALSSAHAQDVVPCKVKPFLHTKRKLYLIKL